MLWSLPQAGVARPDPPYLGLLAQPILGTLENEGKLHVDTAPSLVGKSVPKQQRAKSRLFCFCFQYD